MRVIVFGASGTCGAHFVRLATAAGHAVTAVVREKTHFQPPAGVRVVRGNVLDGGFVKAAVRGHDAVMSGLGMRYRHLWSKRLSPDDFTSSATRNIVEAMEAEGVERISIISAAGIGDSRRLVRWPVRLLAVTSNVGKAFADLERAEKILRDSPLDWQAVRPVTLTRKPAAKGVRVLARSPLSASIPRENVAAYILAELEAPQFSERTPLIAAK